jgi:hypothetical protein
MRMTSMTEEHRSSELEFMAIGILLGAVLGFVMFVAFKNFTIGIGLGVGIGLILSDVIYRRRSEVSSGR